MTLLQRIITVLFIVAVAIGFYMVFHGIFVFEDVHNWQNQSAPK